jgi:hypothetical protein
MLNAREKELLDWIANRRDAMIELTARLVNIDSNSYDKAGVDAVGHVLKAFLQAAGATCEWIPLESRGDVLPASFSGGANGRAAMLLGHRDTVFPTGEVTRRPFRLEGERAYGPGVADMKAGLVMNAFVLAAFAAMGKAPVPIVALFTSDEEIGTQVCRPIIEAEALKSRLVFNAEAGRPSGNVVKARRGGIFFEAEVFGKAAHSGNSFEQGRSAIAEIAGKIGKWFAMNEVLPQPAPPSMSARFQAERQPTWSRLMQDAPSICAIPTRAIAMRLSSRERAGRDTSNRNSCRCRKVLSAWRCLSNIAPQRRTSALPSTPSSPNPAPTPALLPRSASRRSAGLARSVGRRIAPTNIWSWEASCRERRP